jgi:sugar phosphate isomerase/epimerase
MGPVAVSSMFFHEYRIDEIFDFTEGAGLGGIEFWIETPHFWLRGFPEQEVTAARAAHLSLSSFTVHAPVLDLNPCSVNPKVRDASVDYAVQAIGIAERLGSRVLTVHPGRRTAKRPPTNADYERFERFISALHDGVRDRAVRVAIENMEPTVNSLLCTPEGVRELLDREPWLSFTLDVAHARLVSEEEVRRYIDLCVDRLANVHFSSTVSGRLHLPVHEDRVSRRVLQALDGARYRGPITLEIEDRNFDHDLSSEEKVTLLARDLAFIRKCLR